MKGLKRIFAGLFWMLFATSVTAELSAEKILPLDATVSEDGQSITLNWFDAQPPRVGSVTVKRRLYGQTGGQSWKTIADALGPVMRYTDDSIRPGIAYEYQVLRSARDIVDVGYWLAGTEIPTSAQRGHAYVIVDEVVAEAIAPRLARFERDLIGDGWRPVRHIVPRGNASAPIVNLKAAAAIKEWLRARYNEDPFGQHAIILVGHVPVVGSGQVAPDGHGIRPHPTDLFYADVDGRWSVLRTGDLLDSQVPGDFIEMQVGRIDFFPVSKGIRETEIRLLRSYFDKNHHWRMRYHGDLKDAYGRPGHLAVELAALRNIVGANNIMTDEHHEDGKDYLWLWGVDFGYHDGSQHANKAVFALNFGSHRQMFSGRSNAMTAFLARPWYPLAVGWGARPAWWLHHMALGGSIGDVHMRTVNNGRAGRPYRESMDYFPTGRYLMRNGIWVNLLGDPTLRAFMLAPARQARGTRTDDGIELIWRPSADPEVMGYRVYRAGPDSMKFERLDDGPFVKDNRFVDPAPVEGARYMVRAYGLKKVYSGSFFTLSQGVFVDPGDDGDQLKDLHISVLPGQSVALPHMFSNVENGVVQAFVEGPSAGRLTHDGTGWLYTAPADFAGEVHLRFTASDAIGTSDGILTIAVGE